MKVKIGKRWYDAEEEMIAISMTHDEWKELKKMRHKKNEIFMFCSYNKFGSDRNAQTFMDQETY